MIVDASALLAVLLDEPEGDAISDRLAQRAGRLSISPFSYLEAAVRVDRLKSVDKPAKFDRLVEVIGLQIEDTTADQSMLACKAYQKFAKGNHPAKLNLGDCFAYALARARAEPLLSKGDDFRRTDIEAAL